MNRTSILAVGAGLLLLVAGLSAAAAAAPADVPGDNHATDDRPHATDDRSHATDDRSQAADDRSVGPSGGLPGPVPDFVSDVHGTIDSFLNGEVDSLGESLSGLLSDRGPADAANSTGA